MLYVKAASFVPFPVMRLKRVYRSCSGREQFHLRYWNWYWHCLTARVAPYLILAMTSRFSSHRAFCSIFKSGIPSQNRLTVPNIYNWCGIPSDHTLCPVWKKEESTTRVKKKGTLWALRRALIMNSKIICRSQINPKSIVVLSTCNQINRFSTCNQNSRCCCFHCHLNASLLAKMQWSVPS